MHEDPTETNAEIARFEREARADAAEGCRCVFLRTPAVMHGSRVLHDPPDLHARLATLTAERDALAGDYESAQQDFEVAEKTLKEIGGVAATAADHDQPLEHSCCAVAKAVSEMALRAILPPRPRERRVDGTPPEGPLPLGR
jgi:hypothetical protein